MHSGSRHRCVSVLLLAILCAVHAALLAWPALKKSPTIDEVGHLPAGIAAWQSGRFALYRVNPPLVKMIAAAPVALLDPVTDWSFYPNPRVPELRRAWGVGEDFIAANGPRAFWYFTFARWALIPLSLVGLCVCYLWSSELYGRPAGLLAAALWCFSPNILGNAAMITPDAGAAALGVLAGYCFWRWLRRPDWPRALWAGIALGLAELAKATWIILFGLWPLLWLAWLLSRRVTARRVVGVEAQRSPQRAVPRAPLRQLAAILLLGLYLLSAGYGFEGTLKPLGDYPFISRTLGGSPVGRPERQEWGNRFAGTPLAALPVPLPENYLRGIDVQKRDFEKGHHTARYLHGQWRLRISGGWWYFYLYGLLVKVPLGTWALALLAIAFTGTRTIGRKTDAPDLSQSSTLNPEPVLNPQPPPQSGWRDTLIVLSPAIAVLTLVSLNTSVSYFRYLLPAFPFAFVAISRVGSVFAGGSRLTKGLTALALASSVAGSLAVWPHSLSYFNWAAGGPMNGHAHMLDSSIDWGQDLFYLKEWLQQHPEAKPLNLAYCGMVDPHAVGIEFAVPPDGPGRTAPSPEYADRLGPQPGWYAVSVNALRNEAAAVAAPDGTRHNATLGGFGYFLRFQPVATAGYSIYIYHITPDEANRVRRDLGLPPLTPPPE